MADVRDQLDDHAQMDETSQLERALVFAKGPRWKVSESKKKSLLPPLYPEH